MIDFNNIVSKQFREKIPDKHLSSDLRANNMRQTICADDISKENHPIALPVPMTRNQPTEVLNPQYDERNNVRTRREGKITNIESAMKMAEMRREAVSDEFYDW